MIKRYLIRTLGQRALKYLSLASVILSLCACFWRPPITGLPGPEALRQNQQLIQQIDAHWQQQSGSVLAITEVDSGTLHLVATTLTGQEVLHISYDGFEPKLLSRVDELPRQLQAGYILRDMFWAQWPAEQLRNGLDLAGMTLVEDGHSREIRHGNLVLLSVQRQGPGRFHIENPGYGYVLDINTISTSGASATGSTQP